MATVGVDCARTGTEVDLQRGDWRPGDEFVSVSGELKSGDGWQVEEDVEHLSLFPIAFEFWLEHVME